MSSNPRRRSRRDRAINSTSARNVGTVMNIGKVGEFHHHQTPAQEFEAADRSESRTSPISMKCTASQKALVDSVAADLNITPSTLLYDALELFVSLHPHQYKVLDNAEKINAFLALIA